MRCKICPVKALKNRIALFHPITFRQKLSNVSLWRSGPYPAAVSPYMTIKTIYQEMQTFIYIQIYWLPLNLSPSAK